MRWVDPQEGTAPELVPRQAIDPLPRGGAPASSTTRQESTSVKSLVQDRNRGQSLVEYALIITLIAVVVVAALLVLGPTISNLFLKINSSL
jgi:pilus assembly protein Flp/PilA